MPEYKPKRALLHGAFFCFPVCLFFPFQSPAGILCPPVVIDETVAARSASDGDTLRLADGRKVRLIGINTPELARDNQPAEPLASEAKTALIRLLAQSGNRIGLKYGHERLDTYQRTLAHVYLADGTSVQAALLEQGMATAFTTPPDDRYSDCYRSAEQQAMQQHLGLWALADYQPRTLNQLDRRDNGFRRVQGRVSQISRSSSAAWVMLGEKLKIRIAASDLVYFSQPWLQGLVGRDIEVRGWLHPEGQAFFMQLRHPDAVKIIESGK
ncbi:MAG: hypothetical protein QG652_1150 [Pseudomonadota bacterium]|nr:hypothetical protein [Pseudomonadota bacterium]